MISHIRRLEGEFEMYKAEVVESRLRPDYLKQERTRLAAGQLTEAELRDLEDRAVVAAIAPQERAGADVVTDVSSGG